MQNLVNLIWLMIGTLRLGGLGGDHEIEIVAPVDEKPTEAKVCMDRICMESNGLVSRAKCFEALGHL